MAPEIASRRAGRFELAIREGSLIKLLPGSNMQLCCHRGKLLVTLPGDYIDHQLGAGETLDLPANGSALVEGEGAFTLLTLGEKPRRFWSLLAGSLLRQRHAASTDAASAPEV